jgi:CubicO group peptidase (beta-lactamase class C family)
VVALAAFAALLAAPPLAAGRSAALDQAVERVGALAGVRTLDVWVGERPIVSRRFRGARAGAHDVKSASKSVLSALVGIALERRLLPGLDATVGELLPEAAADLDDPRKRAITLRQLLTMTSGLASTSGEHYGRWVASRDWVRAALGRPLVAPPGARFEYSTGATHLIAAALARAAGRDLFSWAREVLFDPLGLRVASWGRDPQGRRFGGNAFVVAPAELAKLGRLYLRGGRFRGAPLVEEAWIAASTREEAEGWPDRYGAYGYLWWLPPFERERGAYLAAGYGGQFLLVAPESDAVVVLTSTHQGKGAAWDRELLGRLERELLPAARAAAPKGASQQPSSTISMRSGALGTMQRNSKGASSTR